MAKSSKNNIGSSELFLNGGSANPNIATDFQQNMSSILGWDKDNEIWRLIKVDNNGRLSINPLFSPFTKNGIPLKDTLRWTTFTVSETLIATGITHIENINAAYNILIKSLDIMIITGHRLCNIGTLFTPVFSFPEGNNLALSLNIPHSGLIVTLDDNFVIENDSASSVIYSLTMVYTLIDNVF